MCQERLALEELETILKNPRLQLKPTDPEPTTEQLEEWAGDSVMEATDGCTVEPDGICCHGHVSWFLHYLVI